MRMKILDLVVVEEVVVTPILVDLVVPVSSSSHILHKYSKTIS